MIQASFKDRSAAISGVYQYDTGQRMKMYGLPTPEEMAARDDFLSGDTVTVQAQYGFIGDEQTETRIASYDEDAGCWMADVPDVYMTKSGTVKVYVYVGYGTADGAARSETCYEGSFTPISRPAPSNRVTPAQVNAWDALVAEVNLTLAAMNTAESRANAAAEKANEQAEHLQNMTVQASTREYGEGSTAALTDDGVKKILTLGLERGQKGEKGDKGDKGDTGTAGVTFALSGSVLYITTV